MTAVLKPRIRANPGWHTQDGQRLVLHDVDWGTYKALADGLRENYLHLTYDRGILEIMTLSLAHERFKSLIGLIICVLAEELNRLVGSFGSFTHQRQDLARGLEPDLCFYLAHFAKVRGKRQIDLNRDPPPDLAVEIEISRTILDRLAILAALKIPEVWRFDGQSLIILVLKKGKYRSTKRSPSFPEIPITELVKFLYLGEAEGDIAMIQAVRTWVRKKIAGKPAGKKKGSE